MMSERLLERAEFWFTLNKLHLNNEKTTKVVFSMRDTDAINGDVSKVRFLGAHLDSKLLWDAHIETLCGGLKSALFVLRNLASSVSQETLRTAYFGLFHCRLSYALLVWGHSSQSERVFRLQRRAVRLIAGLGYREECRGTFAQFRILTLPSVFILENLLYMKRNLSNYVANGDVHEHDTRRAGDFRSRYCRLKRTQNGPDFFAPMFFNRLPVAVRELPMKQFKTEVIGILLNKTFYSFNEFLSCTFRS